MLGKRYEFNCLIRTGLCVLLVTVVEIVEGEVDDKLNLNRVTVLVRLLFKFMSTV